MPSVTDIQQQQQTSGKSTPPPPSTTTTDPTNLDPLSQAVLVLDKKQRNLGKRKEKLEGYREEAKKGKELNKDQKEALEKYSDVLGQIECLKELNEQFKKIQTESTKTQKSLSKQVAKEKREAVSQSLRQYAQVRYLLEHRSSVQTDASILLDQLSEVIIPSDNSPDSISRSVDMVLSIYQVGPSLPLKNLTGKSPQEVRETVEELMKTFDAQPEPPSPTPTPTPPEPQTTSVPVAPEQEPVKVFEQTNEIPLSTRTVNDYPLQFDTRDQQIPLEQIMQDNTFFPIDLNTQIPDDNQDQSPDPNQFLTTITVVNSNQASQAVENSQQPPQQPDGLKQNNRGNNRGGHRNYNRRGSNYYQNYQGPRGGGHYDNSYGRGGRRPYVDHNRGRGGFRGNRGGNYRPHNYNGNGYQNSAQYQNVHSAPPSQQQ